MQFDWDDAKAEINRRKHHFAFKDAIAVCSDPNRVLVDVSRIEDGETRWKVIGRIGDRLFTAVFVMRQDVCRLISARRSNTSEERSYGARNARSR